MGRYVTYVSYIGDKEPRPVWGYGLKASDSTVSRNTGTCTGTHLNNVRTP